MTEKNITKLNATKISYRAEGGTKIFLLDTISRSSFNSIPDLNFVQQPLAFSSLIYFQRNDFSDKKTFCFLLIDRTENILVKKD